MKHKIVKKFLLMVSVLLIAMPSVVFGAWSEGDRGAANFTKILIGKDGREYYINENVETVFYSANGKKTTKAGNGRNKVRWRYLRIADAANKAARYGYCVEFGAKFSDKAAYQAQSEEKDHILFQNLTFSGQKIIAAALCYGRNGTNPLPVSGVNDADFYFATQVVIWEAQQSLRTLVTDSSGVIKGTKLASAHGMSYKHMLGFLKGRSAEKCYKWLVNKIDDHLKTYSFASVTSSKAAVCSLKYNEKTKTWIGNLTDKNKKVTPLSCADKNVSIVRKGYQYTLESKKPISKTSVVELKNKISQGSSSGKILLWNCTTNKDNQALISGANDLSPMYIKVRTSAPSQVEIEKVDGETGKLIGLANTTYQIKESGSGNYLYKDIKTDGDGIAMVPGKLLPGKYQLEETVAPKGYYREKNPLDFQVTEGKSLTIKQKDKPQKGRIHIEKTGEMLQINENQPDLQSKPLSEIRFEITAAEDVVTADGTIRLKKGDLADQVITDTEGKGNSKELYLGKYNILEKETPENYQKPVEPVQVELTYAGQDVSITEENIKIHNKLKTGSVEIEKTDVSTGEPLPNTGIEILDENKEKLLEGRTDNNGIAKFQMLPVGKYYFREFDAPSGYEIDERLFPFEVKAHNEIVKCKMTNKLIAQQHKPETPTKTPEHLPDNHKSPKTGDEFPVFAVVIMGCALGLLIILSRKFNRY